MKKLINNQSILLYLVKNQNSSKKEYLITKKLKRIL